MIVTDACKLEYVYSGLFTTNTRWIHPKKTEITWELIYVISGEVFIEESNVRYHLRQNDLLFLKPRTEHGGYFESTSPVSFYWIHFHIDSFQTLGIHQHYIKNFTNSSIFKNLLHVANSNYPSCATDAVLLTILCELSSFTAKTPHREIKIIHDAAEYIRINSHNKIYLEDISSRYNMHPQYFSKLFKRHYSMGLKEYICMERMNMAKNLLCNTNQTIKEIATIMNFRNKNEFINFFKYHQKQSPSKFRNSFSHIHMNNH